MPSSPLVVACTAAHASTLMLFEVTEPITED
jgi:hypothetical protein